MLIFPILGPLGLAQYLVFSEITNAFCPRRRKRKINEERVDASLLGSCCWLCIRDRLIYFREKSKQGDFVKGCFYILSILLCRFLFKLVASSTSLTNPQRVLCCWSDDHASSSKNQDFRKIFFVSQTTIWLWSKKEKELNWISYLNMVKLKSVAQTQDWTQLLISSKNGIPGFSQVKGEEQEGKKMCLNHISFVLFCF